MRESKLREIYGEKTMEARLLLTNDYQDSGLSVTEFAKQLGVGQSTLSSWLIPRSAREEEQREKILTAHRENKTNIAISSELGISVTFVRRVIREYNIKKRVRSPVLPLRPGSATGKAVHYETKTEMIVLLLKESSLSHAQIAGIVGVNMGLVADTERNLRAKQ